MSCEDEEMVSSQEALSVTYYDDENKPIPPEAEGSVLMALGIEEDFHSEEGNNNHPKNDGSRMGSRVGTRSTTLQPFQEDPQEFERKRLAALVWLNKQTQKDSSDAGDSGPNNASDSLPEFAATASTGPTQNGIINCMEHDDGELDYEEDGMGSRVFTREATSEDEPWILEGVLKRRVDKSHPTNRQYTYLCKWKYYNEPTWEGRELLEDEGFLAQINEFDGIKVQQTLGGTQRTKGGKHNQVDTEHYFFASDVSVVNRSSLEDALGFDLNREVCRSMGDCGMVALYLMSVAVPERVKAFIAKWKSLSATHRPTILYHGTRSHNIIPIVKNGLVVPGNQGVVVSHGSAYGIGIYTAECPGTSNYFCNDRTPYERSDQYHRSGELFVCIGLVSNNDPENIKLSGDGYCIVFFDASFVIPLWVVGFREMAVASKLKVASPTMPRLDFKSCFHPTHITFGLPSTVSRGKWAEVSHVQASKAGLDVPADYKGKPMTKRRLKEAPRMIKNLYKAGALIPLKGDSQK